MSRVRNAALKSKIMSAQDVAALIPANSTVGMSGFTGSGYPKVVPMALAERIEDIHGTLGTIGYYLVGLHAAAALYHHYFMHDDTLRRMLPGRG